MSNGCVISTSDSAVGGALNLANTIFVMTSGTIVNSTAITSGGAVALFGGNFIMTGRSTLSYSTSADDVGAILIGGANAICNLTDVVIDVSTTARRANVVDIVDANLPLLILTFVDIKHYACQDSLFFVSQSTLRDAIVLRNVTLTQPECTATPVEPSSSPSLGCGEKFIAGEKERGVCASANEGACYEEALPLAALKNVACRCPWPEYPNPAFDERLAPYLELGCIKPMQLTGITVVSEKVSVTLQKPENVEGRLNLTLQVEGTDNARPAIWRLLNTSDLLLRSPWLRFPALSGTVNPPSISSGVTFALVPLTFTASGLLERAALYEERLTVDVRSEIASAARTLTVDVSLSVQARTSFVVWGFVRRESGVKLQCEVQKLLNQAFLVDTPQRQYFTACDVDSLPVDHLLPLQRDPRRFRAVMNTSAGTANELGQTALDAKREGPVSPVRKAAKIVLYVRMASTGHLLTLLPRNASPASLAPTVPRMLQCNHSSSSMVSGGFPTLPLNCCLARVAVVRFALVEVILECARQRSQARCAKSALVQISTSWMESVWIVQM
ncbi:hypothetical protein AB1Y20_016396 [Prymnesium parvum]|uniref:Uncharacterized protein n=1 Tax=Prymnesium parvum TaxID=97485 RepID=A0AB34ICK1_PRYPA